MQCHSHCYHHLISSHCYKHLLHVHCPSMCLRHSLSKVWPASQMTEIPSSFKLVMPPLPIGSFGRFTPMNVSIARPLSPSVTSRRTLPQVMLDIKREWLSSPSTCAGRIHQHCRSTCPRCNSILHRTTWVASRLWHCCSLIPPNCHHHHSLPEVSAGQEDWHLCLVNQRSKRRTADPEDSWH